MSSLRWIVVTALVLTGSDATGGDDQRGPADSAAPASGPGRVVLRRLNRVEYENTVRDLLDVHVNLKEQLPQDGAAEGFDNVGAALHTSSFLMERYLEAADTALSTVPRN